ncbi:MAG: glutathione S-transferase family protein [Roseovarius sp.]|uniref:glutathione S-transferase family protein n=1 Tax=Roseovarius sp. TaxID=1486281 RepID=UPI0032EBDFC0
MTLTLYTLDWVPDFPRGFVRDLRIRWALEEIGRPYDTATVPSHPKTEAHLAMQPFGQVPIIKDGDLILFESGAILQHVTQGSALFPDDRRAEITQWLFAALNTLEMATMHWQVMLLAQKFPDFFGPPPAGEVIDHAFAFAKTRLDAFERRMADREWIAGEFSIADIATIDTLRNVASEDGLAEHKALTAYVDRATDRPAFKRALRDHMAHWQAADAARETETA